MIDDIIELLLFFLPSFRKKKKQGEEWHGVVEEKRVKSDYSVAKYKCEVIFRRDDGIKTKLKVNEDDFALFEPGKRYHKRKGEALPTLVS